MLKLKTLACAAGYLVALGAAPAGAQIDPDDNGGGEKLGLSQRNNSGQVGTVTLFRHHGGRVLVIIALFSEPAGRAEPARISRGSSCDVQGRPPAYALAPVVNGISRTLVAAPEAKLLSGNYVVAVRASARTRHDVSCGALHR